MCLKDSLMKKKKEWSELNYVNTTQGCQFLKKSDTLDSSTACDKLKKIQITLGASVSMQKALLVVQDVETRWN